MSPAEEKGKQIYFEGVSSSGREIVVKVGKDSMPLPGSAMPCVKCHGLDGMGREVRGMLPTVVIWSHLIAPEGHLHPRGRLHGPFDEEAVARAVTKGIDPDGNPLNHSMPRFKLSGEDLDAVIAYLKRLEFDSEPGLANGRIQLVTLLPMEGRMSEFGLAMNAMLNASIQEVNEQGGLNGRFLELDVIPYGNSPHEALNNIRQALGSKRYFAMVGAYSIGLESKLVSLLDQYMTPLVGPFSLQTPPAQEFDGSTFYLLSGLNQQVRVLANHAAGRFEKHNLTLAIVGPETPLLKKLEEAVSEQIQTKGRVLVQSVYYPPDGFDASTITKALKEMNCDGLFFFDGQNELDALLGTLALSRQQPLVFLTSKLISRPLYDAPPAFDEKIFIAYSTLPQDVTDEGSRSYAHLKKKYQLPETYLSSQFAMYASVKVLAEGLKRSGHHLSRSRFTASLEDINQFETGVTPPITYSQNRRIGALGAYIMTVDLKARSYRQVGGWNNLR